MKTGVRWNVPPKIAKGVKPLPYFLKYKYEHQKQHNMSKTKMNEHCWFIEKWERGLRFNRNFVNTGHCIYDSNIPFDSVKYERVLSIFKKFRKEYESVKDQERMAKNYDRYKDFFIGLTKFEVENTQYNWDAFYSRYKTEFENAIGTDEPQAELTNYLVELIYNKMNGAYYNLLWEIASDGVLINLKANRVKPIYVPVESEDNTGVEYLGRYYKLTEYKGEV